jgi:hypothetical protein
VFTQCWQVHTVTYIPCRDNHIRCDENKMICNLLKLLNKNQDYCNYCNFVVRKCICFKDWDAYSPMSLQSTPVAETSNEGAESQQETTSFLDEQVGEQVAIDYNPDPLSSADQMAVADLATFLSRPVRIDSFTWLESDSPAVLLRSVNPWSSFFNDTRIKFKLNNFAYLRCKLKVKILVNASPFYYGCMGAAYQPLHALTPSTIVQNNGYQTLIPVSQRPITWIYPQKSEGGEMELPFFYHKNWLDVNVFQDFSDMGKLEFYTFTELQSANGVSGQGVTVQVYAWAEDVELSGSTVALALQSQPRDEYGTGPISHPASTVASIANKLKTIPVIGKFATATEIGAMAVSKIAGLFGYTNVPNINNTEPFAPKPFPHLASCEISYPVEKLTLDPKNELTVDPTVVGAPAGDPLAIQSIVQRESFLTSTVWDTTDAVDDALFYTRVNPWMFRTTGDINNSLIDYTPLAMATAMFDNWRGDIVFRFKIIASPYHKGRVIVAWDPAGNAVTNLVTNTSVTSAVYTQIVDIGETQDVEITVPYTQAFAFLKTDVSNAQSSIPFDTTVTPTFNAVRGIDNGCLIVRVLTKLTAPVAVAPVRVLCFVRGAENMEFANPRRISQGISMFAVQSKPRMQLQSQPQSLEGQDSLTLGASHGNVHTHQFRVNFGEVIRSLRPLLHRANFIYTQSDPVLSATTPSFLKSTFGKLPPYPGFDPNGIHTAQQLIGILPAPYNFVNNTPVSWILPCFVGYRGSTVWTFNLNNSSSAVIDVTRQPVNTMTWVDTSAAGIVTNTRSGYARYFITTKQATAAGTALTHQATNAGLSVLCPNYNYYRFNSTAAGNATSAPTSGPRLDGSASDTFVMEAFAKGGTNQISLREGMVEKYWNAGPDFQPLFFLNVPSYRVQTTIPTAL